MNRSTGWSLALIVATFAWAVVLILLLYTGRSVFHVW